MAQFATADEFANRLGATLTDSEETDADALLTLASGLIQLETGQLIERVVDDELSRRGAHESRIRLPERPVVSVASVTLAGELLVEEEDWYLDGAELVRKRSLSPSLSKLSAGGGWGGPLVDLTVVYTHGYDPVPDAVKAVCVEMVVRAWVNPGSVRQEGYGAVQVTYGNTPGLLLTEQELRVVKEALGRTAGSVTLR